MALGSDDAPASSTGSPPAPRRVSGSRSTPWASSSSSVSACSSARRSAWRRRTSSVSSHALIETRRARRRARGMLSPDECSERSEGAPSSPDFHDGDQTVSTPNAFGARSSLGAGLPDLYRLDALAGGAVSLATDLGRAPVTLKILLENALRHAGGGIVRED